jgi:hypothetical protein
MQIIGAIQTKLGQSVKGLKMSDFSKVHVAGGGEYGSHRGFMSGGAQV